MKSIGVRELRQRASEYLRHVERLVRRGRVIPPTGDLLDLGVPLAPMARKPRPSTVLARARARER